MNPAAPSAPAAGSALAAAPLDALPWPFVSPLDPSPSAADGAEAAQKAAAAPQFSPAALARAHAIIAQYPTKRAAILPVLHLAQREFGHISPEAMKLVAGLLDLAPIKVFEVVTFYTLYNRTPRPKFDLQVCTNLPCALLGAARLSRGLCERLGVKPGQTTPDGKFRVQEVECLGACEGAPMMQCNEEFVMNLTAEKLGQLVDQLRKG